MIVYDIILQTLGIMRNYVSASGKCVFQVVANVVLDELTRRHQMRSKLFVKRRSDWIALFVALFSLCATGRTWYVSSGVEGGDGSSWSSAFSSLQKALDHASAGDSVWVSGGVYEPENVREIEGEGLFATSFELKDGVSIYGGFSGSETALGQRRLRGDCLYSWEFEHETILRQREGGCGSVVRSPVSGLAKGVELNGLVIEHGNASGSYEEGEGGGIWGYGLLTVVNCLVRDNLARNGGGIFWDGALTVMSSGVYGNELISDGWSGVGGGIAVRGDGFMLSGVICVGNGSIVGGVQSGGGLYLDGAGQAVHCTVVGNKSVRNGSGVHVSGGCVLLNSLVWQNSGCMSQVVSVGGEVHCCGIENYADESNGNVALMSVNAGSGGIDVNDNWVDGYYPCFVSPENGDYRLGGGSYALNRGRTVSSGIDALGVPFANSFPNDMGACGSTLKGNLALDFSVQYPYIYGGNSSLQAYLGLASPDGIQISFWIDPTYASMLEVDGYEWESCWLRKGETVVELHGEVRGIEQSYWNSCDVSKALKVHPRPLGLGALDVEYRHGSGEPRLEWAIEAGTLVGEDTIVGELDCDYSGQLGKAVPITRGTLTVDDGNGGENYTITFWDGQLTYLKGDVEVTLSGKSFPYTGEPMELAVVTEPTGLVVDMTYEGRDGTVYGPSSTPPTDAGNYIVVCTVADDEYEGVTEHEIVIERAVLTVKADDQTRRYGDENPELTMSVEGLLGDDTVADVEMPLASTVATASSPVVENGYAIELTGGSAKNYTMKLIEGCLTITKAVPELGSVVAGGIVYGDSLSKASLQVDDTHGVAGHISWVEPGETPAAGTSSHGWMFIPEDTDNYAVATGNLDVVVSRRAVKVSGGSYSCVYGEASPELSPIVVEGTILGADGFSGALERVDGRDVGTYTVLQGTLTLGDNYDLQYVAGSLAITPRPVTLRAEDKAKGVGEAEPALTWVVSEGSLAYEDQPSGTLVRDAGETEGEYVIRQGTLALSSNYTMSFVPGKFVISQVIPVLVASSLSASPITYGDSLSVSVLSGKVVHPVSGEELAGSFQWDDPDAKPAAGTRHYGWTFVPSGAAAGVSPLKGTVEMTVNRALLTVRLKESSHSRQYFDSNPPFELEYEGFVNGDDVSSLILVPEARTEAGLTSPIGLYDIAISGGFGENYVFSYGSGKLEVVKAEPVLFEEVVANTLVYGEDFSTVRLNGSFVPPEPIGTIAGRFSWVDAPQGILAVGTYSAGWVFVPKNENYTSVYGVAEVVVEPADLLLSIDDVSISVDDALPEYSYVLTGFVNGESEDMPGVFQEPIELACDVETTNVGGEYEIYVANGKAKNYRLVVEKGTLSVEKLVPVPLGLEEIHIAYGESLHDVQYLSGDYFFSAGSRSATVRFYDSILTDFNYQALFSQADAIYSTGTFVDPLEYDAHFDFMLPILGTIHWEWPEGLREAGRYERIAWRFEPSAEFSERYAAATGCATVYVKPKVLEIYGFQLVHVYRTEVREELLENYDWGYDAGAIVDGQQGTGYLTCSLGPNISYMDQPGIYPWDVSRINFGSNYYPMIDSDVYFIEVVPQRLWIPLEDRLIVGEYISNVHEYEPILVDGELYDCELPDGTSVWVSEVHIGIEGKLDYDVPDEFEEGEDVQMARAEPGVPYYVYYAPTGAVVDVNSHTINYGDPLPDFDYTIKFTDAITRSDITGSPIFTETSPKPGEYIISKGTLAMATAGLAADFFDGILTVKKRPITISTGKLVKYYGEEDPEPVFTVVEGSLLEGDTLSGTLKRVSGEEAGTYAYKLGTLRHRYYTITLAEDSVLEIRHKEELELDISGLSASCTYGEALSTALVSGDVKLSGTDTVVAGSWEWTYPEDVVTDNRNRMGRFVPENTNYAPSDIVAMPITVIPRKAYLTMDSHRIQWGDPLPVLTYKITNVYRDDRIWGSLSAELRADGNYDITVGTLGINGTYEIVSTHTDDNLPVVYVSKRPVTVEVLNCSKSAGDVDPEYRYRIASGSLATGDSLTDVVFERESGEEPGTYEITLSIGGTTLDSSLSHYEFTFVPGVLEIVGAASSDSSSQTSKVAVNAEWSQGVEDQSVVTFGDVEYVFGVNAFATVEQALGAVEDGGVVLVAPGAYTSPTGTWFLDKGVSIIGDDMGDIESMIVLNGTIHASDSRVSKLLLSNVTVVSPSDSEPALRLGDSTGASVIVNCQLIGSELAVELGVYGSGVSIIYNEITADINCIVCNVNEGQAVPTSPLTLVCNSFAGESVIEANGFSVITSSNIHNSSPLDVIE